MPLKELEQFVNRIEKLCEPKKVVWVKGTDSEIDQFQKELVKKGVAIPLKRKNSFLFRSDPRDVARVEDQTFICSENEADAGPTNNWFDPKEMHDHLETLFSGCMEGRTLYVIAFSMGPVGSPFSKIGVELTDSIYVVLNMCLMTRVGDAVIDEIKKGAPFVPCVHSVGAPLAQGQEDVPWPCHPEKITIAHFPKTKEIWSYGSGYGGNALLGKKCFALRIASNMAKEEGWFAEHMLIMGVTNPQGEKKYFCASFPSSCGKTNLAMMTPTLPGWKVETVGDDIAWLKFGPDGRLYAINPESGFFGVAPGTSVASNPKAIETIEENTLFTNVALTDDDDVWWEGMTKVAPKHLIDWYGHDWDPTSKQKAAHPNARFTVSCKESPTMDADWESPRGVPISAILFGGRRSNTVPLVYEAFSWQHGTFLGASLSSETTAAAVGSIGHLRHDPFAMLPFCGYNMGDYFTHWFKMGGKSSPDLLPRIYAVNWFRKDEKGNYLWPGYGENGRILKWIFDRLDDKASGIETPIGIVPKFDELDLSGLNLSKEQLEKLLSIDKAEWALEAEKLDDYFNQFGSRLPKEIRNEIEALRTRVHATK